RRREIRFRVLVKVVFF
nr:Chain C, Nitric oxide synthase, inducible [synthetic construct]3GOF_D Chain D, Nitric oxide synthase, inducible [synthetic construct]